jgi:hypothetical protein
MQSAHGFRTSASQPPLFWGNPSSVVNLRPLRPAPPAIHEMFYMRIHTILYTVARIPHAITRERYPFLSRIIVSHKRQNHTIKMPAASRMPGFIAFHRSISRTRKLSQRSELITLAETNTILFDCTGRFSLDVVVSDLRAICSSYCFHKAAREENFRNRVFSLCEFGNSSACKQVGCGPLPPIFTCGLNVRARPGISRSAIPRLLLLSLGCLRCAVT